MEKIIPQNYIQSSNLVFISAGLGILNMCLSPDLFKSAFTILVGLVAVAIVTGMGFVIRAGAQWIKYIFPALILLGIKPAILYVINDLQHHPLNSIISIGQNALQIAACVLLFIKPSKI